MIFEIVGTLFCIILWYVWYVGVFHEPQIEDACFIGTQDFVYWPVQGSIMSIPKLVKEFWLKIDKVKEVYPSLFENC